MSIAVGTRLGPYEIVAPIGAGGMGEVYRARDERLGRTVAVKVLPAHLSNQPELRQRFEREARAISSLSHPNICAVFDVGEIGDTAYLVMEYLEGETLADRLQRGPLPIQQVLRYGVEIAAALDAAHQKQMIHRDLKPGNIMLTKSGVKLLDFGLARIIAPVSAEPASGDSPTVKGPLTAEGMIIGTLQYMPPEQLEAKTLDARTDIFAFGAVLYEMITGRRAFTGESQASLIAAILHSDPPPLAALQPLTPPALERIVRPCLAKDPDDRWQTARDIGLQLKGLSASTSSESVSVPLAPARRLHWLKPLLAGAVVGALLAVIVFALLRSKPLPATGQARLSIVLPADQTLATDDHFGSSLAISPDGTKIVYSAMTRSGSRFFLRTLGSADAVPLQGTEDSNGPFFSPDGTSIGFFAGGHLKVLVLSNGAISEIGWMEGPGQGATWLHDGTFVVSRIPGGGLDRVRPGGGKPEPLTVVGANEAGHAWPQVLPDGQHVLFTTEIDGKSFDDARIEILDLKTKQRKRLLDGGMSAHYLAPSRLLFARQGKLFVVGFDLEKLEVTGDPAEVAQPVLTTPPNGFAYFAAAQNGTIAFVPYSSAIFNTRLVWIDRAGKTEPLPLEPRAYVNPRISPNGKRLLVEIAGANDDLWVDDLARGALSRLTFNNENLVAAWNADSASVIFGRYHGGMPQLHIARADGTGEPHKLLGGERPDFPTSVSRDGKWLAFVRIGGKGGMDLLALPLDGPPAPRPLVETAFNENGADFSPDGKWFTYSSDESGTNEVYVRPVDGAGDKLQISTGGGIEPVWGRTGKEVFYRNGDKMMAVDVSKGAANARALFSYPFEPGKIVRNYDVSPDDQRFIIAERDPAQERNIRRIDVLLGGIRP